MTISKLETVIQNYPWGSKSSLNQMFGVENTDNSPQAELWMGAHPNGCSVVAETGELLSHFIENNKVDVLGHYTSERFGELPFLFKILAAETPLSIQVHPDKAQSEAGFARENQQGIPMQSERRCYKDANHKPELVYALTFYKALNGFRPLEQIISIFEETNIPTLASELAELKNGGDSQALQAFFSALMGLEGHRKQSALEELYQAYERPVNTHLCREALQYSQAFKPHYFDDIGLFAPLLLNTVELAPGEAMFLHAGTPHAYVHGTGLELMASSDNVLRAGLTAKHIDIPELINNTNFITTDIEDIRIKSITTANGVKFPVPVDDFCFEVLTVLNQPQELYVRSAEILLCIQGHVTVSSVNETRLMKAGDSVFVSNDTIKYQLYGDGKLARAYN